MKRVQICPFKVMACVVSFARESPSRYGFETAMTSYWSRETESVVRLLIFDVRESGVLIWQIFYTEDLWVIDRSFTAKFWQRGHWPMKIHPRPPNRGSRLNLGGLSELAHLSDLPDEIDDRAFLMVKVLHPNRAKFVNALH